MGHYELRFRASVATDLRGLPKKDVARILDRIQSLKDDPRPTGCVKLSAQERYRIRQGNYRILYTVSDHEVMVEIVKIGHRREIYS